MWSCRASTLLPRPGRGPRVLRPLPSARRAARRRAGSRPTGDREGREPSRAAAGVGGGTRDAPDAGEPGRRGAAGKQ